MEESATEDLFYRWVSVAEWRNLLQAGEFRVAPSGDSYEHGKLVTDSPDCAREWGKKFGDWPESGLVIEVSVSGWSHRDPFQTDVDRIGPAWLLTFDELEGARIGRHDE